MKVASVERRSDRDAVGRLLALRMGSRGSVSAEDGTARRVQEGEIGKPRVIWLHRIGAVAIGLAVAAAVFSLIIGGFILYAGRSGADVPPVFGLLVPVMLPAGAAFSLMLGFWVALFAYAYLRPSSANPKNSN
jgi:hypothetical protein